MVNYYNTLIPVNKITSNAIIFMKKNDGSDEVLEACLIAPQIALLRTKATLIISKLNTNTNTYTTTNNESNILLTEALPKFETSEQISCMQVYEDRFGRLGIYLYVDADTPYFWCYHIVIDHDHVIFKPSPRKIILPHLHGFICHTILIRDLYWYLLGSIKNTNKIINTEQNANFDKITDIVHILAPDFRQFGSIICDYPIQFPLFVGKDMFGIIGNHKLIKWDMITNTFEHMLEIKTFEKIKYCTFTPCKFISLIDIAGKLYMRTFAWKYMENSFIHISDEEILKDGYSSQPLIFWLNFEDDIRHNLSNLNKTHVHTIYRDQMNTNELWMSDVVNRISNMVYTQKEYEDIQYTNNIPIQPQEFRDLRIYFGKDINDILNPQHQIFKSWKHYQSILSDMGSLIHSKSKKISETIKHFLMNVGAINILPTHVLSGQLHMMWPGYGKGWHHNIESVPKNTADVLYFVNTDKSIFGGSFFFYRHPLTHFIHAVPDVLGTMKFFQLVSNKENPLWHAIASFTARRVSLGLSKGADMETEIDPPKSSLL